MFLGPWIARAAKLCARCNKRPARSKRRYCSTECWEEAAQDAYDAARDEQGTVEFTWCYFNDDGEGLSEAERWSWIRWR